MKLQRFEVGIIGTNCYIVYEEGNDKCFIVDPGDVSDEVNDFVADRGMHVVAVVLTHGHFDHIWGANYYRQNGAMIYAYEDEEDLLLSERENLSVNFGHPVIVQPDELLSEGEYNIGGITFRVISTPGHTAGSMCLYFEKDKILISGDTLFYESFGRTDFPSGNMRHLKNSIVNKLFVLPDEVKAYSGHGPETTILHEKEANPIVFY